MQKFFGTIADYHRSGADIRVEEAAWPMLRAGVLHEGSGDLRFRQTDRNGLVLTLDGTAAHLTRMDGIDDETPSVAGSVCAIPQGVEVHLAWRNHADVQTSVMVEFDAGLVTAYAPELVTARFDEGHLRPAGFADRPVLGPLIRLLARETDPGLRRGRLFAEAAIRLLAIEIATTAWSRPARRDGRGTRPDRRIASALDYIEAQFASDVSLIDICAASGLSPAQLTVLFRKATGHSPYGYVIERRLRHAVHLLRTTDLPIAFVALDAGFNDQQHLTPMMRARMRCTPGSLRAG